MNMTTTISIPTSEYNRALFSYTNEELMARIDEGEAQFERGEYKTHEQMMQELREEFSWLK